MEFSATLFMRTKAATTASRQSTRSIRCSCCVVRKSTYIDSIVPALQRLKFGFWGHDSVVLHSHEIRKEHGDFHILRAADTRVPFLDQLSGVIAAADFTIIAAVIDKQR